MLAGVSITVKFTPVSFPPLLSLQEGENHV